MTYKYIKKPSINNIDKCYMHGLYSVNNNTYGVPNGVESVVQTLNIGLNTTTQLVYQYHNSVYAGRVYFRVGSVPQLFSGNPSSTWQAWTELHGVGKPYSGNFTFDQTATRNIGSSSGTVNNLYMQNAVTVVSDENKKSEIQSIPDAVLNAWCNVNFQMYKLNDAVAEKGNKARYHFGVIAQRIKEAFDNAGLDYNAYGLLTYDKWEAIQAEEYKPATYNENFEILTPEIKAVEPREAGEIYMVRYDECMILEAAYQRRKIKQLEDRIAALEAKS